MQSLPRSSTIGRLGRVVTAVYSNRTRYGLRTNYGFDISDRTETQLEDPTCGDGFAICHDADLLAQASENPPTGSGLVAQLYGYVAARDEVDGKLNYVFNRGRDDPITVRRGSLIGMTGPTKRRIVLLCDVLLEFDVRIRNGDREEDDSDDLQLIDGASFFEGLHTRCRPRKVRFDSGDCGGAVDMSFANVDPAVHAIVDVVVSEVQPCRQVSSCLSAPSFSFEEVQGEILLEELQLFRGTIVGEPCALGRFVVAVRWDTVMQLKFKIASTNKGCSGSDVEHSCSFEAQLKGDASHQINLELASILVKVTWATLRL